jgi:REP element-mobilizing transposase RayT
MAFNPDKPNRRSNRLKGYDYSLPGGYFVTIVAQDRKTIFGRVVDGQIEQNDIGKLVQSCWLRIPEHFSYCRLDEHIIMPNHLHGIILIREAIGSGEAFVKDIPEMVDSRSANASPRHPEGTQSGSLGAIIQNFKSINTRKVNSLYFEPGNRIWQRNYYERIIRNERELNAIRQYILDNPLNWELDEENPMKIERKGRSIR